MEYIIEPLPMSRIVHTLAVIDETARETNVVAEKQLKYLAALRAKGFSLPEAVKEVEKQLPAPEGPSVWDL
jgi:hypothetical protein